MLVVVIALVALANYMLSALGDVWGAPLTFERMAGWAFAPIAWCIGVPWDEALDAGRLLGLKFILNEVVAYLQQASLPADALSAHRGGTTFTLLVTRAGLLPLDPAPEDVTALDPRPYEGTMTPSRTALYALRARPQGVGLSPADEERLQLLYDASLRAVDRGVGLLLDRVRDLNLERSAAVIVVGDRGSALGENRTVADGPMSMASVADTALLAWGGPFGPLRVDGVVGVVDAAATALDLFGLARPREFDGVTVRGGVPHDRSLPFVSNNARWDLGLCFGELMALPRDGVLALYHRADDPLSLNDLSPVRPIARAYAEAALASLRPGAGRRVFPPATRVLPAALDALLRYQR
jgi:hypothetical protein